MTRRLPAAGCLLLLAGLVLAAPVAQAGKRADRKAEKIEEKRSKIDRMAEESLARLLAKSPRAKALQAKATAWAVFDNTKVSLGITGGGGSGVAVDLGNSDRTYMRMATGGVNVGLGVQKYQVIFFFNDADIFDRFVNMGWEADASANAVAWTSGKNAGASFSNGMAVFQLTEAGLMLQLDLSGTKYWKYHKLN